MTLSQTQKYLRDFIQDGRLLVALGLIEGHLGLPVTAKASTEVEIAGIQHNLPPAGYIFWYNPNADYTHNAVIFHELMHISLHIEGWPIYDYGEGFRKLEVEHGHKLAKLFTDTLWGIFTHTEIYQREKLEGFSHYQKRLANDFIKNVVIPHLPNLCRGWRQNWDLFQSGGTIPVQFLEIIRALLAPANHGVHEQLREHLKKHLALQAYRQVETICQDILVGSRTFPQSISAVFEATASKLGLPKALLVQVHVAKIDYYFWSKIQKIFQEY